MASLVDSSRGGDNTQIELKNESREFTEFPDIFDEEVGKEMHKEAQSRDQVIADTVQRLLQHKDYFNDLIDTFSSKPYNLPADFNQAQFKGLTTSNAYAAFDNQMDETDIINEKLQELELTGGEGDYYTLHQNKENLLQDFKNKGVDVFKLEELSGRLRQAFEAKDYVSSKLILNTLVPYTISPDDLGFLGPGIPFFFIFIRFCLSILLLMFLLSGFSNLVMNEVYGESPDHLEWNWVSEGTIGAIIQASEGFIDVLQMQIFATIVCLIIYFHFIRKQLREIVESADADEVTPDDFSILVSRIPVLESRHLKDQNFKSKFQGMQGMKASKKNRALIKQILQEHFKTYRVFIDVQDVTFFHHYKQVQPKIAEKEKVIKDKCKKFAELMEVKNSRASQENGKTVLMSDNKLEQLRKDLEDYDHQLHELDHAIRDIYLSEESLVQGKCIVSLNTESQKDQILDLYKDKNRRLVIDGQVVNMTEARDPTDIQWFNMEYTEAEVKKRAFWNIINGFALIIACFGALFGLFTICVKVKDNKAIVTQVVAICISLVNVIINMILVIFANNGKYYTRTDYNIYLMKYMSVIQWLNTGIATIVVSAAFSDESMFDQLYEAQGIIYVQNSIFMSNVYVPFGINLVYVAWFTKNLMRKKAQISKDSTPSIQRDMDELYNDPPFDVTAEYAAIIKTMYMTSFYSVLMPAGLLWSSLALCLVYTIGKWNVTRRSIVKFQLGKEFALEAIEMAEFIIPIYGLASIMAIHMTKPDYFAKLEPLTIIGIIIGFINLALPMQKINERIFHVAPAKATDVTYQKAKESMWQYPTEYKEVQEQAFGIETMRQHEHHEKTEDKTKSRKSKKSIQKKSKL